MPLNKGAKPGSKGFGQNIATEEKVGKPAKQAEAIAYSVAKDGMGEARRAVLTLKGPEATLGAATDRAQQLDRLARRSELKGHPDGEPQSREQMEEQAKGLRAKIKSARAAVEERSIEEMEDDLARIEAQLEGDDEEEEADGKTDGSRLDAILTRVDAFIRKDADKKPEEGGKYNATAVNKEIAKDLRIKGKEAKMIHALLKGRH